MQGENRYNILCDGEVKATRASLHTAEEYAKRTLGWDMYIASNGDDTRPLATYTVVEYELLADMWQPTGEQWEIHPTDAIPPFSTTVQAAAE